MSFTLKKAQASFVVNLLFPGKVDEYSYRLLVHCSPAVSSVSWKTSLGWKLNVTPSNNANKRYRAKIKG